MLTTTTLPSGINYRDVQSVVEAVADNKARQFRNIAWLDGDDIRQEVRLKCSQILHRYKPDVADLQTWLSKCCENRLRDIRRTLLYKHNKPCFRCPFWDRAAAKKGEHDCREFSNKSECDKYARHERYVQTKLSASHPINIDEDRVEDDAYTARVGRLDLLEYVRVYLTKEMLPVFDRFVEANFNLRVLKNRERVELSEELVDILEIYQEEIDG